MSIQLWKATAPSGRDFRTGTIDYAAALTSGKVLDHPNSHKIVPNKPSTYLSVSTEPAETLIGGLWPCRLFRVEPVGDVLAGLKVSPHKRAVLALRVVEEVEGWRALGPNGREVAAVIARAALLTTDEISRVVAAGTAAGTVAGTVAGTAAGDAVRAATWAAAGTAAGTAAEAAPRSAASDAAGYAAWDGGGSAVKAAARAAVVRDLITPEQYDLLAGPWESVMGPMLSTPTVEGEQ